MNFLWKLKRPIVLLIYLCPLPFNFEVRLGLQDSRGLFSAKGLPSGTAGIGGAGDNSS